MLLSGLEYADLRAASRRCHSAFRQEKHELFIKTFTLIFSLVELGISLPLFFNFDEKNPGMQFMEKATWFPEWGISYFLGIDGISLLLVLLTTVLTVLCILSSWMRYRIG